jgi:hypothetical protein
MTDYLDLLHVPSADSEIRCSTHLFASSVRTPDLADRMADPVRLWSV